MALVQNAPMNGSSLMEKSSIYNDSQLANSHSLLVNNFSLLENNVSLLENNFSLLAYDTGSAGSGGFFDTYYSTPRIIVESVLAALSLTINCLALLSSANARNKRYSIYHILFINLCVCNALSLSLTWLSNNSFFLFQDSFPELPGGLCKVRVILPRGLCKVRVILPGDCVR